MIICISDKIKLSLQQINLYVSSLILYSHNEPTHTMTSIICDSNNNLNVIGFFSGTDKCVISLKDLTIGSSMNECLKKYGQPNKIKTDDEFEEIIDGLSTSNGLA